jgi:hypothetical protein
VTRGSLASASATSTTFGSVSNLPDQSRCATPPVSHRRRHQSGDRPRSLSFQPREFLNFLSARGGETRAAQPPALRCSRARSRKLPKYIHARAGVHAHVRLGGLAGVWRAGVCGRGCVSVGRCGRCRGGAARQRVPCTGPGRHPKPPAQPLCPIVPDPS